MNRYVDTSSNKNGIFNISNSNFNTHLENEENNYKNKIYTSKFSLNNNDSPNLGGGIPKPIKIKNDRSDSRTKKETKSHNSLNMNSTGVANKIISKFIYKSKPGKSESGNVKVNQDSFIAIPNILNFDNFYVFGVLDGHGVQGHMVANFVKDYLSNFFNQTKNYSIFQNKNLNNSYKSTHNDSSISESDIYLKLIENNYSFIRKAFKLAEEELVKSKIEADLSGSTCVVVIVLGSKIICANVGDSRAIMVNENRKNANSSKKFYLKN